MNNSNKIILDLCGGTGSWSKPYLDNGYTVINVTLPEYDVRLYVPPKNVYGILAAPPCTEFSLARNRYPDIPRDYIGGMELVNACYRIILQNIFVFHNQLCGLVFWALENPVGMLRKFLGKPCYTFQPYWFGDPYSKKTDLWGNFNIPIKKYEKYSELPNAYTLEGTKFKIMAKRRYSARKNGIPSIADITSGNQKELRAITPLGFAKAFYEVNK